MNAKWMMQQELNAIRAREKTIFDFCNTVYSGTKAVLG